MRSPTWDIWVLRLVPDPLVELMMVGVPTDYRRERQGAWVSPGSGTAMFSLANYIPPFLLPRSKSERHQLTVNTLPKSLCHGQQIYIG